MIFAKASQKFNFKTYANDTTLSSTLDSFSMCEQNGNAGLSLNVNKSIYFSKQPEKGCDFSFT